MGEIDVPHQPEDQREPARDEEVEAAEGDAVEDRVEEDVLAPERLLEARARARGRGRGGTRARGSRRASRRDAVRRSGSWRRPAGLRAPSDRASSRNGREQRGHGAGIPPLKVGPVGPDPTLRWSRGASGRVIMLCKERPPGKRENAAGPPGLRPSADAKGQRRGAAPRKIPAERASVLVLHSGLVRLGSPIFWRVAGSRPSIWLTFGMVLTALLTRSPFGSSTTSVMKFVPIACRFWSSLILPFGRVELQRGEAGAELLVAVAQVAVDGVEHLKHRVEVVVVGGAGQRGRGEALIRPGTSSGRASPRPAISGHPTRRPAGLRKARRSRGASPRPSSSARSGRP